MPWLYHKCQWVGHCSDPIRSYPLCQLHINDHGRCWFFGLWTVSTHFWLCRSCVCSLIGTSVFTFVSDLLVDRTLRGIFDPSVVDVSRGKIMTVMAVQWPLVPMICWILSSLRWHFGFFQGDSLIFGKLDIVRSRQTWSSELSDR